VAAQLVRLAALLVLGVSAACAAGTLGAQTRSSPNRRTAAVAKPAKKPPAKVNPRALSSLDVWIVERFRGAGLLPDSAVERTNDIAESVQPRIESARAGSSSDTVIALHFAPRPANAAFENGQALRLAGPTGTIAPIVGTVLARRAFRAPRVPQANGNMASGNATNDARWRYGWAYIVSLPKAGRVTPAATFRGWLLLDGSAPR
jgi:hypothetical protein